jgi:outer membrane protein
MSQVKSYVRALSLGLALSLSNGGLFAAELKIAVIDQLAALGKSTSAQTMLEDLKKSLEKEKNEILAIEKGIKDLVEKEKRDGAVMSQDQRAKLLKDIEDKKIDYNFMGQKWQKRQQEGQQEILKTLGPKFEKALEAVIKDGKYDIVLAKQAVVFSAATIDITDQVTTKLNALK